jgi:hypothetical protein
MIRMVQNPVNANFTVSVHDGADTGPLNNAPLAGCVTVAPDIASTLPTPAPAATAIFCA